MSAGTNFDEPISSSVSVSFPDSSATFRPDDDATAFLAEASSAAVVYISGRTSTSRRSAADEVLALRRALSARSYLVARGVSPLKIMLNFASAGDFVAENDSPEARRDNQRVTIELVFVPADPLESAAMAMAATDGLTVESDRPRSAGGGRRTARGATAAVRRSSTIASAPKDDTLGMACSVAAHGGAAAAAPCPAGTVKPALVKSEPWVAAAGSSLRAELLRWAEKAGWKLIYDTETNYELFADVPMYGRFDEAAGNLVRLYETAKRPLIADISVSQRLIYITNRPSN
jgi:hypothetical protein